MKIAAVILPILALTACAANESDGSSFVSQVGPVGDYQLNVTSVEQRRFAGVIRQRFDFSCGSAALATLLRFHYDLNVREDVAFRGMWARGDQGQIRRVGFSLLDMKRWLSSRGIAADGYKVPLDKVAQTGIPGIALIAIKNYRHFVVVKGVRKDEVLLGDPSAGLTVMPRRDFEAAWNGVYFVLSNDQPRAKQQFNRNDQWVAFARAPVGGRFSDPVDTQTLLITAPYFGEIS